MCAEPSTKHLYGKRRLRTWSSCLTSVISLTNSLNGQIPITTGCLASTLVCDTRVSTCFWTYSVRSRVVDKTPLINIATIMLVMVSDLIYCRC